jgi:signal transduction histidine kinase
VRTPLNAIVGFSQLLSLPDGSFLEEEKQEFSGHIVNNTKMLTMLLDDILNASAMDSGNYRITYEDGEMNFMAEAAISSAEHRLQPGVRMYYAPESTEPFTFRTDPRRVQQILINLLTNACKHTTLPGTVTVRGRLEGDDVVMEVIDTGTGIPTAEIERIFERFYRRDESRKHEGFGLGLAIARRMVDVMNGEIGATSVEGEGSTFWIRLPVAEPSTTPVA